MTSAPSQLTCQPESVARSRQIERAAAWLADQPRNPMPVIPALLDQFDLTHDDAQEVIALAGRMRMLRQVFA